MTLVLAVIEFMSVERDLRPFSDGCDEQVGKADCPDSPDINGRKFSMHWRAGLFSRCLAGC